MRDNGDNTFDVRYTRPSSSFTSSSTTSSPTSSSSPSSPTPSPSLEGQGDGGQTAQEVSGAEDHPEMENEVDSPEEPISGLEEHWERDRTVRIHSTVRELVTLTNAALLGIKTAATMDTSRCFVLDTGEILYG